MSCTAPLALTLAAERLTDAYMGKLCDGAEVIDAYDVKAWMLPDGVMMVLGQDTWRDWLYYSLDPLGRMGPSPSIGRDLDARAREHGLQWHRGMLEFSRVVYDAALRHSPRVLIGHSLGGAAVQITGMVLGIPAISFAAPRPCKSAHIDPRECCVLNIARTDDQVTYLPPWPMKYRALGQLIRLKPERTSVGRDHQMPHYLRLLREGHLGDPVPEAWPG